MHEINYAIVHDGKIVLSQLPFAEGQRVRVVVSGIEGPLPQRRSIQQVRELLRGGIERFDDPFEPMIPSESWEMMK